MEFTGGGGVECRPFSVRYRPKILAYAGLMLAGARTLFLGNVVVWGVWMCAGVMAAGCSLGSAGECVMLGLLLDMWSVGLGVGASLFFLFQSNPVLWTGSGEGWWRLSIRPPLLSSPP